MKLLSKIAVLALLIAPSCVSDPNFKAYVATDRLDFNVLGKQNFSYIQKDSTLDEAAKITLWRRLNAKEQVIRDAEALLGITTTPIPLVVPLAPLPTGN